MITILCTGSRGDFQPYIALAQQLQKLGKEVRMVGGKSFEKLITGYGIGFYELSLDYMSAGIDPQIIKQGQSSDNPLKMLLHFRGMKKVKGHLSKVTKEMYEACKGSELIVYHPGATIGYFAGEELGIPSVLASPFPLHKTKEVASVIAYGRYKIPNSATYTMLQKMLWTASQRGAAECLKAEFGKLPENFGCPYERVDKKHSSVISCSNYVFPRPKDWNANIHQCGYWFVEDNENYTPPAELVKFIENGEKPVYIGFGSVFNADEKDQLVKLIVEALSTSGKRGIICGMGKIAGLPDSIIAIDSVSHTWLFPRCSVVCHHGGAGTTAAGFRSGAPSVIVPFSNDQFAWAHRAYDLGVGSKPIYRKNLSAQELAKAIDFALKDDIVNKALALSQNIGKENGAADCARVIVTNL